MPDLYNASAQCLGVRLKIGFILYPTTLVSYLLTSSFIVGHECTKQPRVRVFYHRLHRTGGEGEGRGGEGRRREGGEERGERRGGRERDKKGDKEGRDTWKNNQSKALLTHH